MNCGNIHFTRTRRDFLRQAGAGFGTLALTHLLQTQPAAAAVLSPLPQRAPKARSVIFLFMEGGPSHIDLFDPKPELNRLPGKQIPDSFKRVITAMGEFSSPLLGCQRTFAQHGQSGIWVSDWLPELAKCVDDIAVIRSCWADGVNHSSGVCQMNTGSTLAGRPSLGSWVSYGLGTENQDLPAFVVLQDNPTPVINGPRNWSAGFMPAAYQGVRLTSGAEPIPHLNTPAGVTTPRQESRLAFLNRLNRTYADQHPEQSELEARIASYELAYRMQATAPEAVDLTSETGATKELYGLNTKATETFGRMCLHARRLVERGTRFVQLYSGAGSKWDAHTKMEENHSGLCRSVDQPIAGLLRDLKARGLLDSTLVVWGGEFGRTAYCQGKISTNFGRDHHPRCFSAWFAGGGIKAGSVYGETDDFGYNTVKDGLHIHDFHATLMSLLGIDHERLTYKFQGRRYRLTDVAGKVVKGLLA